GRGRLRGRSGGRLRGRCTGTGHRNRPPKRAETRGTALRWTVGTVGYGGRSHLRRRFGGAVSAANLLDDLARQGFTLAREGYGIRVTPASRLTEELPQTIRAHKPALLALLAEGQRPAAAFIWDQAEAERLLAELRAEVVRLGRDAFRSA